MSVQVIVPFTWTDERAAPFRRVMAHLAGCPWPVMVAEDDQQPYRRAQVLNEAVAATDAHIVVINDADSVCPLDQILEAVRLAEEAHGLVFAFRDYVRLDENGGVEFTLYEPSSHGCVAIRRADFFEIGGYNELYVGWGPEDQDFNARAAAMWPLRRVDGAMDHLWHGPRRGDDSPLDTPVEHVNKNWETWGANV